VDGTGGAGNKSIPWGCEDGQGMRRVLKGERRVWRRWVRMFRMRIRIVRGFRGVYFWGGGGIDWREGGG
jgi:hypothetical protein